LSDGGDTGGDARKQSKALSERCAGGALSSSSTSIVAVTRRSTTADSK